MVKKIVSADRRRQAKKLGLHVLEGLAGLAAVCACVVAFYVWQYSSGSISLNAISPNIKDAIAESAPSVEVDFSGITFHRPLGGNLATVLLKNVQILAPNQGFQAGIPEAAVSFEMSGLATGKLRPYRVELRGGRLTVRETAKNKESRPATGSEDARPNVEALVGGLEQALAALLFRESYFKAEPDNVAAALHHIEMSDFEILAGPAGRSSELRLKVEHLSYNDEGSTARIDGEASLEAFGETTPLTLYAERIGSEPARLSARASEFPLQRAIALRSEQWAKRVELTPEIEISSTLVTPGRLNDVSVEVSASGGHVDLSGIELGKDDKPVDGDPRLDALQPDVERPSMSLMPIETANVSFSFDRRSNRGEVRSIHLKGGETDLNFNGSVEFAPSSDVLQGKWDTVSVSLNAADATLQVDGFYQEAVTFQEFTLSTSFDKRQRVARIEEFETRLDGSVISASGSIDFAQSPPPASATATPPNRAPAIELTGALSQVKIGTVVKLWPGPVAMGARDWIRDYVEGGIIPTADFKMNVPAGYLGTAPLQNDMLALEFQFEGGKAHYIPGLTPLTKARGTGKLSGNRFDLTMTSGEVGSLKASNGSILMPRLVPKGATSEFRATVKGAANEILSLIDMEPLHLMSKFGMDPKSIGGYASTEFVIGRPNRRVVPVEMITYQAEARGDRLSIKEAVGGLDLSDGSLNIFIDPTGIKGEGSLSVAGVPAKFAWTEKFGLDGAAPPTDYMLVFDTTADKLEEAGFAVGDMLDGRLKATISTKGKGVEISHATATADLTGAAVNFETMNWVKPRGKEARLELELQSPFQNGNISGPSEINLSLQGYQAGVEGSIQLAEDYRLMSAQFPNLKLGTQTDCAIELTRPEATGGLRVDISGEALNAASFVRSLFEESGGELDTSIEIRADLDRVWLNDGVVADDFNLSFRSTGSSIEEMNLEAHLPDENKVFAWLTDRTDTQRQMTLSTTNAGMLIKGVTGNASVIGGTIDLDAFIDKNLPNETQADSSERVHGTLNARNFQIINMPVLGRLLQAGSLQGLSNLLNGEGLEFGRMDIEFDSHDGVYVIQEGQISGPSLGLTAKGTYDRNESAMNINGTLVPIYSVNRLFGVVPGINKVLASREGEGLLGFTYQIKGSPDKARISVNPLSALAPGFLRRLFQLGTDKEQAEAILSANANTAAAVPQLPQTPAEPALDQEKPKKKSKRNGDPPPDPVIDLLDQKADAILFEHPLKGTYVIPKPKPEPR